MSTPRRALLLAVLVAACSSTASPAASDAPATTIDPSPAATRGPTTAAPTPTATPAVAASCPDAGLPDGRIAFTVGDSVANGIGIVNADGSGYHLAVAAKVIEGQPSGGTEAPRWIGLGRIMFDSNRNGGPDDWHLFTLDVDGGEPVQLTNGADGIESHGDLSPDGSFMVYSKAVGVPAEPFTSQPIFRADPDGRHERQVTTVPEGGVDDWPDISPDGQRIAFTREFVGDDGGLFVVNVDGTELERLIPADFEPERARWSNDGTMIVFHNNRRRHLTESANVWVINADGSGLRQVTFVKVDGQAFYPTWSPDDAFILFVHHRPGSPTNDLAVIPSGGGPICTLWKGTRSALAWESDWGPPA